jgi:hypothetical protein
MDILYTRDCPERQKTQADKDVANGSKMPPRYVALRVGVFDLEGLHGTIVV